MEPQTGASRPAASTSATAPGKLILMGEHAVVYGRPALVATIGLRVSVRMERESSRAEPGVELDLRELNCRARVTWSALREYADRARSAWNDYARRPSPETFARVNNGDPAHLVKVALGEVAREAGGERDLSSARLRVESELPLGSGFGSSAATAVGVTAAALALLGLPTDLGTLDRLALEVERRQHGMPSGADHNAVLRGGVLRVARDDRDRLHLTPIDVPGANLERFSIFHTGMPAESTGEVVAAVRQRLREDRAAVESLLDRMGASVDAFGDELGRGAPDSQRLAELIRDYEACLEGLGVVPDSVRRSLAELARSGLAGKVSGAGSLSEGGAGSLLIFGDTRGATPEALSNYTAYPARLGVPGLDLEVEE